jgi:O-antigen/teichoic acid export membrane protein
MGYVIGIKRVRYNTSVNVAVTVVSLVLMAVTLLLIARRPVAAIIVWLAANWIVGGIALALVVRHARRLSGDERVTMREFLRFGIRVGLVNLVSLLNYRADLYIVAIMTNAASLGMYTVAISAAESLLVPTQVAALVTSPHIGSLDVQEAARLTARCVRNNLLVALVVCGALFALASPLVHILYGRAFLPVVPALRILLVGVFALSLGSPMSTFFTLKLGRPDIPLRFAAMSAVICIAVAVVLVPHFGITGAAVGSTAAYIAGQSVASWWFTRSTAIGLAAMLIPTRADITLYRGFLQRVLEDGRRLVHQAPPAR